MDAIKIRVPKQDEYDIVIGVGLFNEVGSLLRSRVASDQLFIVTDRIVSRLYGDRLQAMLQVDGFKVQIFVLHGGEQEKSVNTVLDLIDRLVEHEAHRHTTLLALGGGVITDLTGFVASIYMRGISYVNLPTTLLAQVDAAIGGKTAVNLLAAKNIIGAFHHPSLVITDPNTLATLSDSEIRHGLAEVIKIAIIGSENLFAFIESNLQEIFRKDLAVLKRVIVDGVRLKVGLVGFDPYELDLRRVLNLGHTLGHALESVTGYDKIAHGDAISIGMMAATRLARARGLCDSDTTRRIERVFQSTGLPTSFDESLRPKLLTALKKIELIRGGALNLVLPVRIGYTRVITDASADELCNCV